jgi:DNA-binding protein H-NS
MVWGFGGKKEKESPRDCVAEKEKLSETEIEALEQFREKIKQLPTPRDSECTEAAHLRWLKARKFDVEKAHEMYENYITWRTERGIENLSVSSFDQAIKTKAVSFMGEDKQGRCGIVIFPARHVPGTIECTELENLLAFTIEAACHCQTKNDKFAILFDYDGWGLSCVDSNVDKVIMNIGQNNYPERLGEALLIRPPWYFSTVWSIVKVFLDEKTKSKFQFVKCYDELRERFTPENLLEKYGGTRQEESIEEHLMKLFDSNGDKTLLELTSSPKPAETVA